MIQRLIEATTAQTRDFRSRPYPVVRFLWALVLAAVPKSAYSGTDDAPPPDTCILRLTAPESARVILDGTDYGFRRQFTYKNLERGRGYASLVEIVLPDGGRAFRAVSLEGGRTVSRSAVARSQIVFCKESTFPNSALYSILPNGEGQRKLTSGEYLDSDPSISPNGESVIFSRRGDEAESGLYCMAVSGANLRRLVPGNKYNPSASAWSPDGESIAFVGATEDHAPTTLFVMRRDGSAITELATRDLHPSKLHIAWAPDESRIAFDATVGEVDYVCTVAPDGNQLRKLVQGGSPDWSPDGKRLAFYHFGIWVINSDGTGLRAVRKDQENGNVDDAYGDPIWSPDGRQILCGHTVRDQEKIKDVPFPVLPERLELINAEDGTLTSALTDFVSEMCLASPNWR